MSAQAPDIAAKRAEAGRLSAMAKAAEHEARRQDDEPACRLLAQAVEQRRRAAALMEEAATMEQARKADLRRIHAAAREIGVPEDAYRALVSRCSGGRTASAGECGAGERAKILQELSASGWRPRLPQGGAATMRAKLARVLAAQNLPDTYAEAILRTQRGISDPRIACPLSRASDQELRGVLAALYRRAHPGASRRRHD